MMSEFSMKRGRRVALAVRKTGAMLAACLALTGCISLGGKVPDLLLTLTPEVRPPAGEMGAGSVADAIIVVDPDTDRRLDVTRVPVQVDPSTVSYLKDAVWVEKPARQFRRLLAETIRATSKRVVVEGGDNDAIGKTVVSGRLVDMGYDAREQSAIVRFDAVFQDGVGAIRSRRFEAEIPGIPPKAASVGPALNEAANMVVAEVAEWIGAGG